MLWEHSAAWMALDVLAARRMLGEGRGGDEEETNQSSYKH